MIESLIFLEDWNQAKELLRKLIILLDPRLWWDSEKLMIAVLKYRVGEIDEALSMLAELQEKAVREEELRKVTDREYYPRPYSFTGICAAYIECHQFESASKLFEEHIKPGVPRYVNTITDTRLVVGFLLDFAKLSISLGQRELGKATPLEASEMLIHDKHLDNYEWYTWRQVPQVALALDTISATEEARAFVARARKALRKPSFSHLEDIFKVQLAMGDFEGTNATERHLYAIEGFRYSLLFLDRVKKLVARKDIAKAREYQLLMEEHSPDLMTLKTMAQLEIELAIAKLSILEPEPDQ